MSQNGKYSNPRAKRNALKRRLAIRRAYGFQRASEIRQAPKPQPCKLVSSEHARIELTDPQTHQQDHVDNAIYQLLNQLRPDETSEIPWCIECIALVREAVMFVLYDHTDLDRKEFYPWIADDEVKP